MRYNTPFGLPEDPVAGPFTRYVNGNPVTGTEGSIPPAKAFDETQIEIVNVLTKTKDLTGDTSLTPSHTDLEQLWKALQALFARKFITTQITKTVHGPGADFADLHAALLWLSDFTITQTGSVTFLVAAGKWTYTQTLEIDHPNACRVVIQGGALLGGTPQPNNLSVTGYHSSTDGSNQIVYLRSVHATESSFTGGVNGFVTLTHGVLLRYLLITGSQTVAAGSITNSASNSPSNGNGIQALADIYLDGISIWGFGSCGIQIKNANVISLTSLSIVCAYNNWQGIENQGGNFVGTTNGHVICVSNSVSGLSNYAGIFWAWTLTCKGHGPPSGNAAIHSEVGGMIATNFATVQTNQAGIIAAGCATILMQNMNCSFNATYGLFAYGNPMCWVDNSVFFSNGTNSIIASTGAFVEAVGCALFQPTSPPLNTFSNAAAFIYA